MPLPDPCSGWPSFDASLDAWGALLLQALAPVSLTAWHDGDPTRQRFVGQPGVAANLDVAGTSSADIGVSLAPTGNVLASPPNLGAQLRWIRRGVAPGVAGLHLRGEIGLDHQLSPPPASTTNVLAFELLSGSGAAQPEQVSLAAEATVRPSHTTIELNLTVIDAPGPVRVRVGVVSGTPSAATAKNAITGANQQAGFLDDGGTASVIGAAGNEGAGVELLVTPTGGGPIPLLSQLRVEITLPAAGSSVGPQVAVLGGAGFDLSAQLLLAGSGNTTSATVALSGLPERLAVALTPSATGTSVSWSSGSASQPRSARLPELSATLVTQQPAADPVTAVARLEDLPPGIDMTIADGSLQLHATDPAGPSAIAVAHAELLSGFQVPPALTDFLWLDLPASSAAGELRDIHTVEATWAAGAPITAHVGSAVRHPLTAYVTAPALRGHAGIEDLPLTIDVQIDTGAGSVQWQGSEPITELRVDGTLVTTDAATGAGTGLVRVVGEIDGIPEQLDVDFAADHLALAFQPAAPQAAAATVQFGDAAGWAPGTPPPDFPVFDREIVASLEGLPAQLGLTVAPGFAALTEGAALQWRASGPLVYAVAQLNGFALGETPITSVRARVGGLPGALDVEYALAPLSIDLDTPSGGEIGAIHVLTGVTPVAPDGAAPRRIDVELDQRGGAFDLAATLRGLAEAHVGLPIGGGSGPNEIDGRLRLGTPGGFPGGYTPSGPALRGWLRSDELDVHVDAGTIADAHELFVDLDTLSVRAQLPMTVFDVDASGRLPLAGTTYDFVADLRAPVLPDSMQLQVTSTAGGPPRITYEASSAVDDVIAQLQATPAPLLGMQHARAELTIPSGLTLDLERLELDVPDGIEAKLRVRSSVEVPLPTTSRRGQVARLITVPEPHDDDAVELGPFGFLEAAVVKLEDVRGFVTREAGPTGGPMRGPRIFLNDPGVSQPLFASVQRRLGPNRLLRLAQAQLAIARPERIDLLTTPGASGEVGVRFPGPLRPFGNATTLGNFTVRLEPAYAPVPGGPPTGERDPAFVVTGLQTAGIGGVSGTIAAVPAHVEFALTTLGAFGTRSTPLTITSPFDGTTLGIPAGWDGMRVDLTLNGILALRNLNATLYSLDWRGEQRWQRITASRIDVQPTGRDGNGISPDRTITLHQFGLSPTVGNGGSGGLGLSLAVPTTAPINLAAVIRTANFPRSQNPNAAPAAPTGFQSPTQVDLGRLSGFLGLRVDPVPIINAPLIPTERDAVTAPGEWRIVATTPVAPVFLGNTDLVPLSVLAQIGLGVAAALVGGLIAGPWGAVAGVGLVIFEAQYFTALQPPVLGPLPSATT